MYCSSKKTKQENEKQENEKRLKTKKNRRMPEKDSPVLLIYGHDMRSAAR